ncbi:protease FtsH-inhibitory lysogeny factor CIII [Escherichia coli]|nr:protease FtsH-inhibitory lysogeny factor CIII [Escherichia coli]
MQYAIAGWPVAGCPSESLLACCHTNNASLEAFFVMYK